MICTDNFTVDDGLFEVHFQKDKEYIVTEINGKKFVSVGIFNIPFNNVKDKFKE